MATITPAMRARRMLISMGIGLAILAVFSVALAMVRGRYEGLSISQALVFGLKSTWPSIALAALVFYIMWGVVYLFIVDRPTTAIPDAIESGRARWKRMRLYISIGLVSVIIAFAFLMHYGLTRRGWDTMFWIPVVMVLLALAFLVRYWVHQPGRDYLYVLGTGDPSRINDERTKMISDKAAYTTLWIVGTLVFYGGILYEMIILGSVPWRTYISAGLIFFIYQLSRWYWGRKL